MASIGRSLGDFGSDIGRGYDINLDWRQRLQNLAFQAAKQKQDALVAPLMLQELQQRIKAMQQPQPAGVEKLPGGGLSGVTFKDGVYSLQNLAPGAPPEPKFKTPLEAMTYYANKGDAEKFAQFKTIYDATRPQPKPLPGGFTGEHVDTKGRLWGFNKDTNQYEIAPTPGAKFPVPGEGAGSAPGNLDALVWDIALGREKMPPPGKFGAAVATRMKELGITPPKIGFKQVPPDIQNLLAAKIPKSPTAEQSRRLADAADRVFGGTAYKQDLIARGRRSPLMGLRSPYEAATYDGAEYADIVNLIKQAAGQQGNTDATEISPPNVPPPPGFVPNRP